MSSIPLAALHVNPPEQQPNALEQYARLMQLKQQQALMPGQLQQQQQQIQAGQQENQVRAQQIKDQQAMTAAMQDWDGKDLNALPGLMLKRGASAQAVMSTKTGIIKQQQDLANLTKDQLANEKTKNDYFVQALDNVKELPPEQQAQGFQAAVQDAVQKGHLDPQMAQGLQYQGPQQLDILKKTLMGHNAVVEQALKGAQTTEAANRGAESAANTAKIQAELNFYQKRGLAPGVPLDAQEAADWMAKNPGKGASDFMAYKAKLVPAFNFNLQNSGTTGNAADVAKRFGMSPAAFDQAAEKYFSSGQLPPAGRGGPALALNKAIMNRVAELHPDGSLAGNAAAFKANQDSLKSLQKNFDQVTAFENTAGKNLDVFLGQAQKVIDSGNPMINRPLRMVIGGMGGADQAAFDAARTTALTEISKVLNSSNASGVLSDSARHEVEGLIKPNATLQQIVSAAKILKQDMGNRHQSYQEQIDDIQKRLNGSGRNVQQPSTQQQSAQPAASGGFDWNAHPKIK